MGCNLQYKEVAQQIYRKSEYIEREFSEIMRSGENFPVDLMKEKDYSRSACRANMDSEVSLSSGISSIITASSARKAICSKALPIG